ncbi:MAG: peptidoglycan DD-metalloendopeptidase family protein [Porticoccaceae bacterium]|nr:peptidoglycan DD-metalloendopeptidase family protein [Porticoccaceae bacterium]MBT7565452.1 peptidoglycan DD-metalloendopeptidase family protein [Porticoccaceae bacterium]
MARLHRRVVGIFIALLLNSIAIADGSTQVELSRLKQTIATLEKTLATNSGQQSEIETELVQVEIEASKITTSMRLIRQKIGAAENKIAVKEKNKIAIERRITLQNSAITEQIRAAHKLGDQEPIKLLLNQEDPKAISRMFKYYDYFLDARGKKIEEYLADVKALTKVIEDINKNKLELVASKKSLSLQQENLAIQVTKRTLALDKMQLTMADDKKRLRGLRKQRGQLELLLNAVQQAVEDLVLPSQSQSFVSRKGELRWPLNGRVAHRFGSARNGPIKWQGWLINANAGAEVKSVHQGRVVFSNYLRGFGLLLIIEHGNGYMTLYGHNQELLKDTGDSVQTNEVVARAGNTGGLDKSALYFEIRSQGKPANPKKWMAKS